MPKPGGDNDDDDLSALLQCLSDNLDDPDVLSYARGLIAKLVPDSGMASDSGIIHGRATGNSAVREMRKIQAAEAAVRPFVGAMDTSGAVSENGVYIAALHALGHNTKGLAGHANAAKAMFDAVKHGGVQRRMATDGAAETAMRDRFPGVAALKHR